MTLIKKDLDLFTSRFVAINEDVHDDNYLAATKKLENGKQILQDKMDNSDKAAHPFLKKQMQMIDIKQNKINDKYNTLTLKKQAIANQVQAAADEQIAQQQQAQADAEAATQQQQMDMQAQQIPQQDPNVMQQPMQAYPQQMQPQQDINMMQQPAPIPQPQPMQAQPMPQPQEQQEPVYDPNDPAHASLIKQYHHHKMAEVRAAKTQKQIDQQQLQYDMQQQDPNMMQQQPMPQQQGYNVQQLAQQYQQ